MSVKEEISKAIAAHGKWKQKLRQAIDTGQCESTPEKVSQDNNCAFGKWLHYRIPDNYRQSKHYKRIVTLHADFHREAGAILALALAGKAEAARQRMQLGGEFSRLSAVLTKAMTAWQQDL